MPFWVSKLRAHLVASIRAVDFVLVFSEPMSRSCLRNSPDVMRKELTTPPKPFPTCCSPPPRHPRRDRWRPRSSLHARSTRFRSQGSACLKALSGCTSRLTRRYRSQLPCRRRSAPSFPSSEIIWLTHPRFVSLVESSALASQIWPVDSRDLSSVRLTLGKIRSQTWDASIDYQGLWKSSLLPFLGRVRVRIGFSSSTVREFGVPILYTDRVVCRARHIADQNGELTSPPEHPRRSRMFLSAFLPPTKASFANNWQKTPPHVMSFLVPGVAGAPNVGPLIASASSAKKSATLSAFAASSITVPGKTLLPRP